MAISQMQKLSLVFPKDKLDQVLVSLQKMQGVEIRDVHSLEHWQEALTNQMVGSAVSESDQHEATLQNLSAYQKDLEQMIAHLHAHLPSKGLLATLKTAKPSLVFEELEGFGQTGQGLTRLEAVKTDLARLKTLEESIEAMKSEQDDLRKWQSLDATPKDLRAFQTIKARVGTIPSSNQDDFMRAIQADPNVTVKTVYNTETEYGVIVFSTTGMGDLTGHLFDQYEFKPFDYDLDILPSQHLEELTHELDRAETARQTLLAGLRASQGDLESLQYQLDYVLNQQARQDSKAHLASTDNLTALEGWIETVQVPALKVGLVKAFGDQVYVTLSDVLEEDWHDVPIKLKNHSLVEPFEMITEMYSLPKYHEKDPTPFLAPFYFTFFGMMVADLGYGLLLFVVMTAALKLFALDKGSRRFVKFFQLLAISVSLWGLVYGSFFGYDLPIRLLSTTNDVVTILGLSVVFGFITLLLGLILGGLQQIKLKDYAEAYTAGFSWVMILSGIGLIAASKLFPNLGFLSGLGTVLAILNAVGILVVSVWSRKGLGAGLFNLYNISSYAGDLVSFTRLMALGLSGASIGSAFNLIVDIFPIWAKFSIGIVIFILLHAVNLFLSLLSGYVHGARLIFVEFFGKFYEGGGRAFSPLKPAEKYITIKKEVHLEDN